jgi:hypothetical protein
MTRGDDVPVSALRRRGIKKPCHVVEKGKDVSTEAPAAMPALVPFSLKARFKARCVPGDRARQNWQIRVHRAISWYKDACECPETLSEARFLFLWIALNSLYSHWDNEHNIPGKDGAARQEFVRRVCDPQGKSVFGQLFQQHRGLVKKILENPFLAEVFWRNPTDPKAKGWGTQDANHLASHLKNGEIGRVLDQVFSRLYVLRGQMVHGAATSGSRLNVATRRYCLEMLGILVPPILYLVIEHHREDPWPELCYPPQ